MLIKKAPNPPPTGYAVILLHPRCSAMIDVEDYDRVAGYHWRLIRSSRCFYAARRFIRNGKTITIKMHRFIMNTPEGYECHHVHGRTLDNRKSQLQNLTPSEHRALHGKT